jgi:hypothetical protein
MEITVLLGSIHFAGRLALKAQNQEFRRYPCQMLGVWMVTTGRECFLGGELFSSCVQKTVVTPSHTKQTIIQINLEKALRSLQKTNRSTEQTQKAVILAPSPRILKWILLPLCLLHQSQKGFCKQSLLQPSGKGEAIYAKFNTRLRNFI